MAMLDFEKQTGVIAYANEFDVCLRCLHKYMKETGASESSARIHLQKKLTSQKVAKINAFSTVVCLCKDCVKELNDELNPTRPIDILESSVVKEEAVEQPVENNKKGKDHEKGKNKK